MYIICFPAILLVEYVSRLIKQNSKYIICIEYLNDISESQCIYLIFVIFIKNYWRN